MLGAGLRPATVSRSRRRDGGDGATAGARSERPAMGMGSPERCGTQVENLCYGGPWTARQP